MKVKNLAMIWAALAFSLALALPAGAAPSSLGVTVEVLDGYSCDYGVDIPFTRSARTRDYTFALYAGSTAAGTPTVKAEVAGAGQRPPAAAPRCGRALHLDASGDGARRARTGGL